ncbi:hypothetical protein FUAX_30710 [Fulvitalea axinellae]|uniref:ABC-2 type transport system permease protein n=1 Tax=Fulvitalea axinellae TaxID=1182444 RepID=A0AAU9D7W4_9BACT|nr:hypothetical protein FUAX_30710 [Fulvitalea axinellae]
MKNLAVLWKFSKYNMRVIFGNKFIYFFLAAVVMFLLVGALMLFEDGSIIREASIYTLLLFPGVLLIFYPASFGIQNDKDAKMLEIIFTIPDYRFRVWIARLLMVYVIVYVQILGLTVLVDYLVFSVPIMEMSLQVMFPLTFLGCLAFMMSARLRNGNASALVVIILCVGFMVMSGELKQSQWNLFLNPFEDPGSLNAFVWQDRLLNNRLYIGIASLLALMYSLVCLQKREGFR